MEDRITRFFPPAIQWRSLTGTKGGRAVIVERVTRGEGGGWKIVNEVFAYRVLLKVQWRGWGWVYALLWFHSSLSLCLTEKLLLL